MANNMSTGDRPPGVAAVEFGLRTTSGGGTFLASTTDPRGYKEVANPVSLSDLDKALDDLIMQDAPPPLEDTDITVMRLARRAKVGTVRATSMLESWAAAGKVESIGERRDARGHKVKAWKVIA
jgi:hypothetical protein